VDFPSSPSAMMKYRVADDDELSQETEDHRPQHNGIFSLPTGQGLFFYQYFKMSKQNR
jgi:hypothetical protein